MGAVTVQIFPSAQLGGEVESAKNVQLGTLDATIVSTSNLASFYDKLAVFSVPYIFKSVSCSFPVVDGPVGKEMADHLLQTARMRVLGYPTFGARHLFNTKRRVIHPEDLKGLKIRAPDPLLEATWRSARRQSHAATVPRGVQRPAAGRHRRRCQSAHQHEDVPLVRGGQVRVAHQHRRGHRRTSSSTSLSSRSYRSSSRTSILKAAAESIKANRASEANLNKEAEAFLKPQGVNFDTPNQDEFRTKLAPVFDDAKKRFGGEMLDRIARSKRVADATMTPAVGPTRP